MNDDSALVEQLSDKVHQACSAAGCERSTLARSWCRMHYLRWYRTGTIDTPLVSLSLHERLWIPVDKTGSCWIRRGGSGSDYTRLSRGDSGQSGRDRVLAHVLAWEEATGLPVPSDLDVLHTCDNRPCVRNDDRGVYVLNGVSYERRGHLFLGTNAVNVADRVSKGRTARGLASGRAKTTPEAVREMRGAYRFGGATHWVLADRFGIHPSTVRHILTGRRWAWVS